MSLMTPIYVLAFGGAFILLILVLSTLMLISRKWREYLCIKKAIKYEVNAIIYKLFEIHCEKECDKLDVALHKNNKQPMLHLYAMAIKSLTIKNKSCATHCEKRRDYYINLIADKDFHRVPALQQKILDAATYITDKIYENRTGVSQHELATYLTTVER